MKWNFQSTSSIHASKERRGFFLGALGPFDDCPPPSLLLSEDEIVAKRASPSQRTKGERRADNTDNTDGGVFK